MSTEQRNGVARAGAHAVGYSQYTDIPCTDKKEICQEASRLENNQRRINLAFGKQLGSASNKSVEWDNLFDMLESPKRDDITTAQFLALPKEQQTQRKNAGFFVGGTFAESGERKNLKSRSVMTIDIDKMTPTALEDLQWGFSKFCEYEFVAHTTRSHTKENPRVRVIIPLDAEVAPEQYRHIASQFLNIDPASFKPNQVMFLPSVSSDGEYLVWRNRGKSFPTAKFLATAPTALEKPKSKKEVLDITDEKMRDVVQRLAKRDEFVNDYHKWVEVGMAIHHQTNGEGLDLWADFSSGYHGYKYEECEAKWDSFGRNEGTITFASLLHHVRDELNVEKFSEPESIGTDTQNAEAFAAKYKDELLYIYPGPVAHKWDGVSYVECRQAEDSETAIRFAGEQLQAAVQIPNNADGIKEATKLHNRKRQTDMLALAKALPALKAHTDEFNLDPLLLGVGNGVVNLRTGEHIKGDRSQRISKRAGTFFDAKAKCPQWVSFLEQVLPDKEVRDFLQRAIGYTLTGDVSEDVLFFLVGTGANGKTVLTDILAKLTGDHRHTLNKSTLLQRKFDSDESLRDIIKLQHMRLSLASELSAGERWNDGALKALVQTSEISGRDLYKSKVTFKPTHKLWICSNSEPRADDQSDGLWRRICKVPFNVTIPPDQRDAKLSEKLSGELPGILNWAIAGCLAWQRDGRLIQPEAVKVATSDYRKSNDTVARWLEGRFKHNPQSRLLVKTAHDNYVQFCGGEGLHYLDRNPFGIQMKAKGYEPTHSMQGRYYAGVSLQTESGGFDAL
jgi:P4 family phage/plasmid primase-like protien